MMADRVVVTSVQRLVGTMVHDAAGKRVGRIEEMRAVEREDGLEVRAFVLGRYGLLMRVAAKPVLLWVLAFFGMRPNHWHDVPWNAMDLSDPAHPRLRHRADRLNDWHE